MGKTYFTMQEIQTLRFYELPTVIYEAIMIFVVASHAQVSGDLDGTPLFITVPMGLYMLFSKECCIV